MSNLEVNRLPLPGESGCLREAIRTDKEFKQAYLAIEKALLKSFAKDAKEASILLPTHLNPPQSAIKDRFKICQEWIIISRLELGYSLQRCLDMLPRYLANKLYGTPFDPEAKAERGYFVSSDEANHG
jgi:hypothetical protein